MKLWVACVASCLVGCGGAFEPSVADSGPVTVVESGDAGAAVAHDSGAGLGLLPECQIGPMAATTCCGLTSSTGVHQNACGCVTDDAGVTNCDNGPAVCACPASTECSAPGNGTVAQCVPVAADAGAACMPYGTACNPDAGTNGCCSGYHCLAVDGANDPYICAKAACLPEGTLCDADAGSPCCAGTTCEVPLGTAVQPMRCVAE